MSLKRKQQFQFQQNLIKLQNNKQEQQNIQIKEDNQEQIQEQIDKKYDQYQQQSDRGSIIRNTQFKNIISYRVFVDKTLFIKKTIQQQSKIIHICMPYFSGKTQNLKMLKSFLQIKKISKIQKFLLQDEQLSTIQSFPQINSLQYQKNLKYTQTYKSFVGGVIRTRIDGSKKKYKRTAKKTKISKQKIKLKQTNQYIKIMDLYGQYPVIYFNFFIDRYSKNDIVKRLFHIYHYFGKQLSNSNKLTDNGLKVKDQYQKYLKIAQSYFKIQNIQQGQYQIVQNNLQQYLQQKQLSYFPTKILRKLSELLYFHYNKKKVWILFNQLSAPIYYHYYINGLNIVKNNQTGKSELQKGSNTHKLINFVISLLKETLNNNPYLQKAVMVDYLNIKQLNLSQNLPGIKLYGVEDYEMSQFFSFSPQQIKMLLDRYQYKKQRFYCKDRYKFYSDRQTNQFNIKKMAQYVAIYSNQQDRFQQMIQSSTTHNIREIAQIISRNQNNVNDGLYKLINDEQIKINLEKQVSVVDLAQGKFDTFFTVLVRNGHLAISDRPNYIRIPNQFVRFYLVYRLIRFYYRHTKILQIQNFLYDHSNIQSQNQKLKIKYEQNLIQEKYYFMMLNLWLIKIKSEKYQTVLNIFKEQNKFNEQKDSNKLIEQKDQNRQILKKDSFRFNHAIYHKQNKICYIFQFKQFNEKDSQFIIEQGEQSLTEKDKQRCKQNIFKKYGVNQFTILKITMKFQTMLLLLEFVYYFFFQPDKQRYQFISKGLTIPHYAIYHKDSKICYIFEIKQFNEKDKVIFNTFGKQCLEKINKKVYKQYIRKKYSRTCRVKKIIIVFNQKIPYFFVSQLKQKPDYKNKFIIYKYCYKQQKN